MQEEKQQAIVVSPEQISKEALNGIVESFIMREGTDYGSQEVSFTKKKEQVLKQIEKQKVLILFEAESSSIHLMTKIDWEKTQT